jgi:hypothetical protein
MPTVTELKNKREVVRINTESLVSALENQRRKASASEQLTIDTNRDILNRLDGEIRDAEKRN